MQKRIPVDAFALQRACDLMNGELSSRPSGDCGRARGDGEGRGCDPCRAPTGEALGSLRHDAVSPDMARQRADLPQKVESGLIAQ